MDALSYSLCFDTTSLAHGDAVWGERHPPHLMTDDPQTMTEMPMRRLGPDVSVYALGAMTFGAETDESEAHRMLDGFAARGGTLIDTADVYSAGLSEEMIGCWRAACGGVDDMIIASKCRFLPTPGSRGGARRAVLKRVEASLKRLQLFIAGTMRPICSRRWRRFRTCGGPARSIMSDGPMSPDGSWNGFAARPGRMGWRCLCPSAAIFAARPGD